MPVFFFIPVIGVVVTGEVLVYLALLLAGGTVTLAWMIAHREELMEMIRDNVPGLKWIEDKLAGLLDQFFSDNADTAPRVYKPSPKHDPGSAQRGPKGNEMDLTDKEAQGRSR